MASDDPHDTLLQMCKSNAFSASNLEDLLKEDSSTINQKDDNGNTAVYELIVNSKDEDENITFQKMIVLIKYGAEVNIDCNDDDRVRPLFHVLSHKYVTYNDDHNIFKLFVDKGVDPNVRDREGNTALFFAATIGSIHNLIEVGTDMNAQNNDGDTILHILCRTIFPIPTNISNLDDPENYNDIIENLLHIGGDLFITNNANENVIDVTEFSTPILNYIKDEMMDRFGRYKRKTGSFETEKKTIQQYADILEQIQKRDSVKKEEEGYDYDSYKFPELTAEMIDYLRRRYVNTGRSEEVKKCILILDPLNDVVSEEERQEKSVLHIIQQGGPARFDMPVQPYITTIEHIKQFIKEHLRDPEQSKTILSHALRVVHQGKEITNNRLSMYVADIPKNGTIYFVFNIRKRGLGGKSKRKMRKTKRTRK